MNEPQAPETTTTTEAPAQTETTSTPAPETAPAKPLSQHDAIRAAAKKLSGEPEKPAPKPAEKPQAKPGEQPRGPDGKFASTQPQEPKPATTEPPKPAAATSTEPPKPAEPPASTFKAPQSWTGPARDALSKADPVIQAEVAKRERDYAVGIQQHAERAKIGDAFQQAVRPFEHLIAAEGSDPVRAVQSLLQTSAALRTAPLPQRAQLLGAMVRTFLGTDEQAVNLLAQAIDGAPAARQPQAPQIDSQTILAQVKQQLAQEREQFLQQTRAQQLARFAETHEHFGRVQRAMAGVMEQATEAGQTMTLDEAYHTACMMLVPEYAAATKQREAATAAAASVEAQRRTEAAASSVRSAPATPPVRTGQAMSRQDAIRQAAADLAGRGRV